jgi:hypothetical protein
MPSTRKKVPPVVVALTNLGSVVVASTHDEQSIRMLRNVFSVMNVAVVTQVYKGPNKRFVATFRLCDDIVTNDPVAVETKLKKPFPAFAGPKPNIVAQMINLRKMDLSLLSNHLICLKQIQTLLETQPEKVNEGFDNDDAPQKDSSGILHKEFDKVRGDRKRAATRKCYLCGEEVKDYSHFCSQLDCDHRKCGMCLLWGKNAANKENVRAEAERRLLENAGDQREHIERFLVEQRTVDNNEENLENADPQEGQYAAVDAGPCCIVL